MVEYRDINIEDADRILDLCLTLDDESDYMMYERGERTTTVDAERERIRAIREAPNQTIIVAASGDALVGYIGLYGGEFRRTRHVAWIVAGVRASHSGQGIGSALFRAGEAWALDAGITRLELTVMTHNAAAVRLYDRRGFMIEGTRRNAMFVNGRAVDEYYMGKLLV
jgi:RimJ/RimL family protein N-acetyltransferase